jgi:hypothetical protein
MTDYYECTNYKMVVDNTECSMCPIKPLPDFKICVYRKLYPISDLEINYAENKICQEK